MTKYYIGSYRRSTSYEIQYTLFVSTWPILYSKLPKLSQCSYDNLVTCCTKTDHWQIMCAAVIKDDVPPSYTVSVIYNLHCTMCVTTSRRRWCISSVTNSAVYVNSFISRQNALASRHQVSFWATVCKTVRPTLSDRCLFCRFLSVCLSRQCIVAKQLDRSSLRSSLKMPLGS